MDYLRTRPILTTAIAYSLAAAAVISIAAAWGFEAFADAWSALHPGWLAVAVAAELLTFPAYVAGYRTVAHIHDGPRLDFRLATRMVLAGFGPFTVAGGFGMDKRVLHALEDDESSAITRVLGMGALEWAVLAPAAWICAVVLLAVGDHRPLPSLLWPWAIAVPVGFGLGLWLAAPSRSARLRQSRGRFRGALGRGLRSVGILFTLAREFRRCWSAWFGAVLYWVCDIAAFYGSVSFVGLHLNLSEVVLGYATGYALTRRSMPLGGAGATEALMTFALHWVGQPVPKALAAVVVYRLLNFVLPTLPALAARPGVEPLLMGEPTGSTTSSAGRSASSAQTA